MPSPTPDPTFLDTLATYPRWLVAAGGTVVAVVVIWLLAKILKVALYVLMALVLVGGIAATFWYLFH
jgi:hypothetical protein